MGSDAAGDLASAIRNGQGPVGADRVLGVALLADPGAGTKGAATVGPKTSGEDRRFMEKYAPARFRSEDLPIRIVALGIGRGVCSFRSAPEQL
ncbi:hypothetical protein AXA44_34640 [Rhodococcus sp. SC4]|nr:hypothetical protein AXA44_34640 [Rhodococcus sp. SC4]